MEKSSNLRVRARFQPHDVDALVPELVELVDTEAVFSYAWQMDEDEPFPGEWVLKTHDKRFANHWIPERDLAIIKDCA